MKNTNENGNTQMIKKVYREHGNSSNDDEKDVDVVLEIPRLEVDSINLDVEQFGANLDFNVNAMELIHVDGGLSARLKDVNIKIEGVKAEVYLNLDLEPIKEVLEKVNSLVDNHAEIFASALAGGDGEELEIQ